MKRLLAAGALVLAGLVPAAAQQGSPAQATPEEAAAADVVVDPNAALVARPKQADLLTGLYATHAVIEICAVPLDAAVTGAMAADEQRLETSLGMDAPTGDAAYAAVKADVQTTAPDCAEGSPDRAGVDAVTAIYAQAAATPAPAGVSATPAAAPAP